MVETGGRNPPFPPNFVTMRQLRDRRLVEVEPQAQLRNPLLDRSSTEEKPDDRPLLPPNFVSLRQLREWRLKEEQEKEEEKVEEVEKGNVREEEPGNPSLFPPDYVSVRQLQAQRLVEEKEEGSEKEREVEKVKEKKKEKVEEEEKRVNYPNLPPNYVSLRQLMELRLKEKEQKEAEERVRLQQTKLQKESGKSVQIEVEINNNVCNLAGKVQSRKPGKLGSVKSSWVQNPVLPPAGTSSSTGTSSADMMILPENAGVSCEVVMVSSDQNGNAEMNPMNKWKKKKHKKKKNRKITSGKDIDEPVKDPERPTEVTNLIIGEEPNSSSSATKEVTLSQNGNNTSRKVKGKKSNLNESSNQSIPVRVEVKRFDGMPSRGFKTHNGRNKMKSKKVNLSEPSQNVVPMCEVAKESDVVKDVTGTKVENGKKQKGKGKMVNIPKSSDQTLSHEEAKGIHEAGEFIGSEILSGKKGSGINVNLPESSQYGGEVGDHQRKRNQAAGSRGRGHSRAGRFHARPAELLRGEGGLVWVPKKSS